MGHSRRPRQPACSGYTEPSLYIRRIQTRRLKWRTILRQLHWRYTKTAVCQFRSFYCTLLQNTKLWVCTCVLRWHLLPKFSAIKHFHMDTVSIKNFKMSSIHIQCTCTYSVHVLHYHTYIPHNTARMILFGSSTTYDATSRWHAELTPQAWRRLAYHGQTQSWHWHSPQCLSPPAHGRPPRWCRRWLWEPRQPGEKESN